MGVPKFYRWISERYPKINEIVSDSALLPEFDHLYLDMNGIIHGCTHPSDRDISDVLSEKDMMLGIMHYLDRIITQIVKPKVSLYMAIDGVAPRAKLNQQRSRRFRSAKDMAEATKDLPKDPNKDAQKAEVFDSNCITPGTEFMAKVSDHIKYFIRKKLKEDPLWRDLHVVFSGHEVPGEGEHKIMDHIRHMKSQPGYKPNTRHCIYGQDADLIMLGLVTHEPHFTILREVIDFGSGFRRNDNALKTVKKFTKESDFQLLHLSVLREYLNIEFCKDIPGIDLERSIDDFVFMTFLVGNDFLPHLNTLDISEHAFDLLFRVYKEHRPTWGANNYLTSSGEVSDAARLERFLSSIGEVETETLQEREKNDAAYLKKKRRWDKRDGKVAGPSDAELAQVEEGKQTEYESMLREILATKGDRDFVDGWSPPASGEKDFKGRYYFEKLKLTPLDHEAHHALRKAYVEGLMWCLAYYYKGCISWGWYYPYHYGPMLSDLRNLPIMFEEINFVIGAPLTPFEQLMGCLPPASSSLVPKPYRKLMTDPGSPILSFYPTQFEVDMNGKKNPWEGVNILPFIDATLLKEAIAKYCPPEVLTPNERHRNRRGHVLSFVYDMTCSETVQSPNQRIGLSDIISCMSRMNVVDEPDMTGLSFQPILIPGTRIPYPGFPSLDVIPIAATELVPVGLNVFGMPSKYPNLILNLHEMPALPALEVLAENVLSKSLFINWPMMHEARVIAISNDEMEIRLAKGGKKKTRHFSKVEQEKWRADAEIMMQGYLVGTGVPGSGGARIGEVRVRLRLNPLQGMKTNPVNGSTSKVFGNEEADVPLQLALWQAPAPDPRFYERGPLKLGDRFETDCRVVLTKGKYRGCSGIVVGVTEDKKVGVKVQVMPPEVPFGVALAKTVDDSFILSSDASRILKMDPRVFGKVAGSLRFEPGKFDIGLNLKSGDGLSVAGFTRPKRTESQKVQGESVWASGDAVLVIGSDRHKNGNADDGEQDRITWEYTPKAIRLVNEYRKRFPQLFNALARLPNEKVYDASKVLGPGGPESLKSIREWLDSVESAKLPRTPSSTRMMSREAVAAVEKASDVRNLALSKKGFPKESLIKVPGSALYRENSTGATDIMLVTDHNQGSAPVLGDRVVNLCATGIPFGARGTVIGIHHSTTGCVEVVLDEEFVGGTSLQGHCSNFRGKLCVWAHLLKVSPENSDSLVDNIAPAAVNKAAIDKILANIESEAFASNGNMKSSWDAAADENLPTSRESTPASGRSHSNTKTRAKSADKKRAGSRPRAHSAAKQAGWREASGPAENGTGFRSFRSDPKSGIARWKQMVQVGVTRPKPSSANSRQPNNTDAAEGLKAILGVGVDQVAARKDRKLDDPSEGLKSLLGVGRTNGAAPQADVEGSLFPPPPPPPAVQAMPPAIPTTQMSAADKLFQLMAQKPSTAVDQNRPPAAQFNFTYVEEGSTS